ncbi:bifunctional ADP-dependent NAD(P)H-hydrate dehydratase/NAD(P)H-hydrate epimerase [Dyella japonica]|uniref:Bifunctional NAD(P)H-hydrate repair enzyme n=1 Tax=Dyella japonica A8 TaxID=1217721 RepID=A0A075K5G0_9GAMM|nr:bifunctional ADP-dependent NAD(P)H-hydrate dehydratase/NAD(P)H-hydrate epimerase [Dyella japonica]AIF48917.1 carbohydrate kinase [Dyella japonica A8]
MTASPHRHELYTVEQVRALDRRAIDDLGVPGYELMQRAAAAALVCLRQHWPQARRIAVYGGPGNNGGDGFLLAALAREAGIHAEVFAWGESRGDDAVRARREFEHGGGTVHAWREGIELPLVDVHVDALYGTGLQRALTADIAGLVQCIHATGAPVLALDVPSGVNADTGDVPGVAVQADVTVTFIALKRGLFTGLAPGYVGTVQWEPLGLTDTLWHGFEPDAGLMQPWTLPPRPRQSHKGSNGHVLAIGGDHGTAGAVRLCGEAALRGGAGLVSVATRADHLTALNSARPELMAHDVHGPQALEALLPRATVLAVGPGLGQGAWGHALWLTALDSHLPLVLDADGLNLLAREPRELGDGAVITPHPGEAARLLGCDTATIGRDRYAAVRELARRYRAVAVLKGAGSLVADPHGRVAVCPWGNPGMATGGMGDLLTGIIAALIAQGCGAWQAACLGVSLHARAGDVAARHGGERGLIATDLLDPLRRLLNGRES